MQAAPGLNAPFHQLRQSSSSSSSKVDPTQVPRPSAKGDAPEVYRTSGNQYPNPPTSQARFIVRDTGNANPRFMRCTLSMMPYSNDLLKQSAMPLAVVVQPFALLDPADDPTQVSHLFVMIPSLLGITDFHRPASSQGAHDRIPMAMPCLQLRSCMK